MKDMVDKVKSISEATLLPISLVMTLLGGVSWLTTIHARTEAIAVTVEKIEKRQEQYNFNHEKIIQKLSRIEGKLNIDDK